MINNVVDMAATAVKAPTPAAHKKERGSATTMKARKKNKEQLSQIPKRLAIKAIETCRRTLEVYLHAHDITDALTYTVSHVRKMNADLTTCLPVLEKEPIDDVVALLKGMIRQYWAHISLPMRTIEEGWCNAHRTRRIQDVWTKISTGLPVDMISTADLNPGSIFTIPYNKRRGDRFFNVQKFGKMVSDILNAAPENNVYVRLDIMIPISDGYQAAPDQEPTIKKVRDILSKLQPNTSLLVQMETYIVNGPTRSTLRTGSSTHSVLVHIVPPNVARAHYNIISYDSQRHDNSRRLLRIDSKAALTNMHLPFTLPIAIKPLALCVPRTMVMAMHVCKHGNESPQDIREAWVRAGAAETWWSHAQYHMVAAFAMFPMPFAP